MRGFEGKALWIVLTAALGLLVFSVPSGADAVWYPDWLYRQEVTISSLGNTPDLSNFPALVQLTDQDNSLFDNAQLSGNDILFTASDGVTKLNHEIEYYSHTGTKQLDAWVQVPTLPAAGTKLYMYYGNAGAANQQNVTGTWDNNYQMVQHFQESGASSGVHKDSTSNANNGTPYDGATPANLHIDSGKIEGADAFDGSNDYVDCPHHSSLNLTSAGTITAWLYVPNTPNRDFVVSKCDAQGTGSNTNYWLGVGSSNQMIFEIAPDNYTNGQAVKDPATFPKGAWTFVAGTFDGSNIRLYINENEKDSLAQTITPTASTGSLRIGHWRNIGANQFQFNGTIDEVRISDTARTDQWLEASYNNQNDPGSQLGFGQQESGAAFLYGVDFVDYSASRDDFFTIDPDTGAVSNKVSLKNPNGSETSSITVLALAADPGKKIIYGIDSPIWNCKYGTEDDADLFTIDPDTHKVTRIGALGLDDDLTVEAAAFDKVTGRIYASSNGNLYWVDVSSGAATEIGDFDGITGTPGGLAFDSTGTLYAGQGKSLYEVNKTTGVAALVGTDNNLAGYTALTCHPDTDVLYGVDNTDGGGSYDTLFIVSKINGDATDIGYVGTQIRVGDIVFLPVPEPSTLVLLALGVLGMLARRWRKRQP